MIGASNDISNHTRSSAQVLLWRLVLRPKSSGAHLSELSPNDLALRRKLPGANNLPCGAMQRTLLRPILASAQYLHCVGVVSSTYVMALPVLAHNTVGLYGQGQLDQVLAFGTRVSSSCQFLDKRDAGCEIFFKFTGLKTILPRIFSIPHQSS